MIIYALVVLAAITVWSALAIVATMLRRRAHPVPPLPPTLPSVSIVVTALNEEQRIESAMRSLLALEYPSLEIVAIDDRSTDATGAILDRLAAEHPDRMRVVHVTELPAGWLGKCHALARGAAIASGEWLLFTDADVVFEPGSLTVAIAHAHARDADHIVFAPTLTWHGYVEAALLVLFSMALMIGFRSWWVESRSLRSFVGFGSFNLVRRSIYDRFGGHRALRMEVVDDMKLGYLVKKHGGRSTFVDSDTMVRVRWREGARDVIRGLERSGFAGVDFRWTTIIAATAFFTVIMLAPYVLLLTGPPEARIASTIALALLMTAYAVVARAGRAPLWVGLLHPVACVMFAWAMLRSAVLTTKHGGVMWRGTLYSIEDLRRGSVR
ncbi:MAG TPA: glycosyltransferase family 2 protein [Candidatus Kapabacteria bacterium]|nr:glycosyltransferase family 2 protein [Candidatus Kapabacteria bacterium]